jgi:hypothetical protein
VSIDSRTSRTRIRIVGTGAAQTKRSGRSRGAAHGRIAAMVFCYLSKPRKLWPMERSSRLHSAITLTGARGASSSPSSSLAII